MGILGRKKLTINFERVANMCGIQCTGEEIASVEGVSYDTLVRRIDEEYGLTFAEYYKQHSGKGKASLRRKQFEVATKGKGNVQMLIWLGKQHLGQADKKEIESPLGTMTPTTNVDLSGLTDDELRQLSKLGEAVKRSQPDTTGIST